MKEGNEEPQVASAFSSLSFVSQNCPRVGVGEAIKTLETAPLTPRKISVLQNIQRFPFWC